jgi:signal transduction histidine kinase/streptogramin lyase
MLSKLGYVWTSEYEYKEMPHPTHLSPFRMCLRRLLTRRTVGFLLFLAAGAGYSQPLKLDQFEHTAWTARDGAPRAIRVIDQDQYGMLWLGADSGLYQFDGLRFTVFEPAQNDPQFPSVTVLALKVARDGATWVGFGFGGIAQIKNNRVIRVYGGADGLPDGAVLQLAQTQTGSMVAIVRNKLFHLRGDRWEEDPAAVPLQMEQAIFVFYDRDGGGWVATQQAIWHLEPKSLIYRRVGDAGGIVGAIAQAPDRSIWFTAKAVNQMDAQLRYIEVPDGKLSTTPSLKLDIARFLFDSDGLLWAQSFSRGIVRVDLASQKTGELLSEVFGHMEGLSANGTAVLFKDFWNDIWVGTTRGLDRFRQSNLVRISEFESNQVLLTSCPSGELWTASLGAPLRSIKQGIEVERLPSAEPELLYCDPSNVVWYSDSSSFSRFKDGRRELLPSPVAQSIMIRQVTSDGSGGLFASVLRAGLWRFSNDIWSKVSVKGFPQETPSAMFMDDKAQLWSGYIDGSIAVLQGTHARMFPAINRGALGVVLSFCNTRRGMVAAGTNGLAILREDHFQPIPLIDPTAGRGVSGVLETPNGDVWLNGAHGIARIRASEIDKSLADRDHRVRAEPFAEGGILGPSSESRGLPTAVRDPAGLMWFATSDSIVTVNPANVKGAVSPPILGPPSVTVDGTSVFPPYVISHGDHTIRIKYQGIYLAEPQRVAYQIKLDGLDQAWQNVDDRSEAVYTALRAGTYRFHVMASNNGVNWAAQDATLTFRIQPAFYQTVWFIAPSLATLILALWMFYRIRLFQVTKQLETELEVRVHERERIARDLHDTLLQGTQGLILLFQSFAGRLPQRDPMRNAMESALNQADDLLNEARDSVADLRTAALDLDAVATLAQVGAELFSATSVHYSVTVTGHPIPLIPTAADDIYRIAREALTNAARHAQASRVDVEITYTSAEFRLVIRDDGNGFDLARREAPGHERHFGLTGMRERAQRIGGTLALRTEKSAGVEIEVVAPAALVYPSSGRLHAGLMWRLFRLLKMLTRRT